MWLVISISILVLIMSLLGGLVLLRGAGAKVNASFSVLAFAISIWVMANFLGANFKTYSWAMYAVWFDFISASVLVFTAWNFAAALLRQADGHRTYSKLYEGKTRYFFIILATIASVSTLFPAVVHFVKSPMDPLDIVYGSYYIIYSASILFIASGILINLYYARRLARNRLRQQVSVMLFGLFVSVLSIAVANLVVPQFSESASVNLLAGNLSYLGIAFFVAATSYSIVRHRLFDIRLVLARSAAYLLLVSVLAIAYGASTVLISNTLVRDYELSGSQFIVPLLSIIVLTFTVTPLSRFFNRLTNRIFYKDSYEPQHFLGDLNKVAVTNVDVNDLLNGAAAVIERYLKSSSCIFEIRPDAEKVHHVIRGVQNVDMSKKRQLFASLSIDSSDVIVVDELTSVHDTLRRHMEAHDIEVSVRLATSHGQVLGFLLLGHKRNGTSYTSQDVEVLNIASGELVIAIQNAMRFEEIEAFNATLQEKIEDATRRLRQTNAKLKALDQTKDDFISMASHQLRTPLTSVKGYVSMVLDGDAGEINELQRKLLTQSFISSQRMVYLISDLLNVSRLKTGKFVIEPVPVNLADIIEDEVNQLHETASGRDLKLIYKKPDSFPTLMLDETKIRQVIMNFMDNAIYYTPSGGQVTIHLTEKPQSIEFTVVDNGIGVPKHEQHHLFSKFYRAHNAKRARPDGTGLGLFMAKKVIVAQGGAIIFKSQEKKGSTFGFTFAKARLQPPAKP